MPNIQSRETHDVKAIPDSHIVISRITERARLEFRDSLTETDNKLAELSAEQKLIREAPEAEQDAKKLRSISRQFDECIQAIKRAWVGRFLVSTDLVVDDTLITPDNVEQLAPQAFYDEVTELITSRAELGSPERKNLPLLFTSSDQDQTTSQPTIAPVAA